ncbi:MAG: L-arabinose isomerase [Verrucomicrobia bacterium]|jgi:L-arabinose isomerase|nr:L-arabinose isomerase [Verrucomicrobiota bacterium]
MKSATTELWFVTGSQHLYGPKTLEQVAADAKQIASALNNDATIPVNVVWKPTVKTPDEVYAMCRDANADANCVGLITWMHTFSPAKMWIAGLSALEKPFVHLHTQFGRDIPWSEIDMDFMNLNQSAHGGREFGYICTRLRKNRTVVVGHWEDPEVREELGVWARTARGWNESQDLKVARFGDNMREVAVTEGDKVEAQIKFGYAVHGYGMGDLKAYVDRGSDAEIDAIVDDYHSRYTIAPEANAERIREQARIEVGMRAFLEEGGFGAFTTTFENLHGFNQLPGLAVQRLMADGYGFGAEGDWKTAAMVRIMKVMGEGLDGGTSFMEDYTYHLDPSGNKVLGSHMLEVCPSIAAGRPSLETHPLGIGGKDDPARLVFNAPAGPAINVSPIDLGDRFRIIVSEVEAVVPEHDLPKLPVARALWVPKPNLKIGAAAWILAGGAHHTAYSQQVDTRHIEIFCEMADVEVVIIDESTKLRAFKRELCR